MYYPNNSLSDDITPVNDFFLKQAKPYIRNVKPYTFSLSNTVSSSQRVIISGKNFFSISNIFLSGSNPSMLDGVTFFNLFSSEPRLSAINPSFSAVEIPTFTQIDNVIYFDIPPIKQNGFLDVIVLNEAGYGVLSRDSYKQSLSALRRLQLPSIYGIKVGTFDNKNIYFASQTSVWFITENNIPLSLEN